VKGAFEMVEITYYGKRSRTWWEVFEFSWLEQKPYDEKYWKIKERVEEQGKDPHSWVLLITLWFWLLMNEWVSSDGKWSLEFIDWTESSRPALWRKVFGGCLALLGSCHEIQIYDFNYGS
jgi:hypothetical protein